MLLLGILNLKAALKLSPYRANRQQRYHQYDNERKNERGIGSFIGANSIAVLHIVIAIERFAESSRRAT